MLMSWHSPATDLSFKKKWYSGQCSHVISYRHDLWTQPPASPALSPLAPPSRCHLVKGKEVKIARRLVNSFLNSSARIGAEGPTTLQMELEQGPPQKQPKINGFHWGYSPKKGVSLFQLVFGCPPCRSKGSPKTQPACEVARTRPSHGPQQSPFGRSTLWWFVDWKIHGSNMGHPVPK